LKKIRSRFRSLSLILESIFILGSIAIVPLILMSAVKPKSFLSAAPSSSMQASRTGKNEVETLKPENAREIQEAALQREDFATLFRAEDASEPLMETDTRMEYVDDFEGGRLLRKSDLNVLVITGTYFEMGRQYGYLQAKEIGDVLRLFDSISEKESSGWMPVGTQHSIRRMLGGLFEKHFPDSAKQMLDGVREGAAAAGIKLDRLDLAFLNSLIDIAGIGSTNLSFTADGWSAVSSLVKALRNQIGTAWIEQNCDTLAVWGSRTELGKTFQTRNTDITVGMGLERFPLAYVAFPVDAKRNKLIPYAAAGFAGQIGVSTGLNAYGVGLGQVWAFSNSKAIGRPWSLTMIDVMANAQSASAAAQILRSIAPSTHTYGNNFVFADAKGNGIVVELNAKTSDTFVAGDPREFQEGRMTDGRIWAVPLQEALVRADFSMSKKIRVDQTSARGPNGYPPEASSYQNRYAGQIQRILGYERLERKMGAREAAVISRATADRNSGNMQIAVYANTDRKMWVSYATNSKGRIRHAYQNPFVLVPFDQILSENGWIVR